MLSASSLSLLLLAGVASAHNPQNDAYHVEVKRQAAAATSSVVASTTAAAVASAGSSPPAGGFFQTTPSPQPSGMGTIPALNEITGNAPTQTTAPLYSSATAGQHPTGFSAAPPLPSFAFAAGVYPELDQVPITTSPEVQQWLSEIDMSKIPNLSVTDGTCSGNPAIAAQAAERGWWTCGGYTRDTDITICPDKLTWGLSYDDGPSPYTPLVLDWLSIENIKATFFVVGSRVISRPEMLQLEHVAGHQISVHTWSHPPMTSLTNEQIVAELGWTKKAIKDVIGVTPNTWRPPYGDIDDRVRAIAQAMGLTPIIWTKVNGVEFDTDDWKIAGGTATGLSSLAAFDTIIAEADKIDTGFIVLEHDLYQQSVDLAVGYILPSALNSTNPKLKLTSVIDCFHQPISNAYLETSDNSTHPGAVGGAASSSSSSSVSASASSAASSGSAKSSSMSKSSVSTVATSGMSGSALASATAANAAASSRAAQAAAAATSKTSSASRSTVVGLGGLVGLFGAVALLL